MIEVILLGGLTVFLAVMLVAVAGQRDRAEAERDEALGDAAGLAEELRALERMQGGRR